MPMSTRTSTTTTRCGRLLGAFGIGLVHGTGGSAGVGVLILAAIPSTTVACVALVVLALFTAVSMTIVTTGFGFTLSSAPVAAAFNSVAPVLGLASLAFGVWYAVAAWGSSPTRCRLARGGDAADADRRRGARRRAHGSRLGRVPLRRRRGASGRCAENVDAFASWRLRQRVLCGIDDVSTATTVLGQPVGSPVVVAPVAYQRMAHADGEEGMARAAAAAGSAICLSTFSTASPADVAAAAPDGVRFLQVYVFRDHGVTDELIAQAIDAGFSAVFLTVDLPVRRAARPRASHPLDVPGRLASRGAATRSTRGVDGREPRRCSTRRSTGRISSGSPRRCRCPSSSRASSTPRTRCSRPSTALPASSSRTTAAGSSTAPRRRSRRCPRSSTRSATGWRCCSTAASGAGPTSRRRSRSARRAVLAGRMPLWGLAAGGEEGARTVLELLREELAVALHLTGCRSVAELAPAQRRARRG